MPQLLFASIEPRRRLAHGIQARCQMQLFSFTRMDPSNWLARVLPQATRHLGTNDKLSFPVASGNNSFFERTTSYHEGLLTSGAVQYLIKRDGHG